MLSFSYSMVLAVIMAVYMLLYPPFLSVLSGNLYLRLTVEAVLLSHLLFGVIRSNKMKYNLVVMMGVYLTYCAFMWQSSDLRNYISSLNKILFFVLVINLFEKREKLLSKSKFIWIFIWNVFSISAIIAFLGYELGIIRFHYSALSENLFGVGHEYLISPLFGAILLKNMFGISVARFTGYMTEPGIISFFFGFNILIAKYIFDNKKSEKYFIYFNAIAGLLTFSMTYIFFLIVYLCSLILNKLRNKGISKLLLLTVSLVSIYFLIMSTSLLDNSSFSNRLLRVMNGFSLLENNNFVAWFFGNGGDFASREVGMGISAGILSTLVEKGLILLILIVWYLIRYTKFDPMLLFYILYYHLVFEFFWSPFFWVGIAISYGAYFHSKLKTHAIVHASP